MIRCTWPVARSCCSRGPLPPNGGGGDRAPLGCSVQGEAIRLRDFQRRFLARAFAPGVDTAALSIPRGNGKSTLLGNVTAWAMTPGHRLHTPGAEIVLCAPSMEQARTVFRVARAILEPMGGFSFMDSAQRIAITCAATHTRLRVHGRSPKTIMGLVGVPLLVVDEPASLEVAGGTLLHDAAQTAQGKLASPLRVVYIGTLAGDLGPVRGWWPDLIRDGSHGSTYVQTIQGDPAKWDDWREIRRCNPLVASHPEGRAKLLSERDAARRDSRLRARFMSFRLNLPSQDESAALLTVGDWQDVIARPVPDPEGRPICGLDLGGGRAWSAAVACWRNGRVEAVARAPGVPSIADQERRDRVPRGTYQALVDQGVLKVSDGRRVQPPADLLAMVRPWAPEVITCDRFRFAELLDAAGSWSVPIVPRVSRWSEAANDIRGLRRLAKDGPLAVAPEARGLLAASIGAASVRNDDQGSYRLVKRDGANNTGRDDAAAALVLAAGALARSPSRPRRAYIGRI